jgi:hypothetical protein
VHVNHYTQTNIKLIRLQEQYDVILLQLSNNIVRLKHIGRPGRALYFPALYVFKET